jgi:glycosyltransferase involved in cell wall biosynthesis
MISGRKRMVIDARMMHHTGIGSYVRCLLRFFSERPPEHIEIVALRPKGKRFTYAVASAEIDIPLFSIAEQIRLPAILRHLRADGIHSPQFNISLFSGKTTIVTLHDCAFDQMKEERPSTMAYAYYKCMMRAAVSKAERIISVSEATKAELTARYGISRDRIRVTGTATENCEGSCTAADWRDVADSLGIRHPFVLYCGLIRPRKNLMALLHAVRRLKEAGREMRLVIAGAPDTRFLDIAAVAKELRIADRVIQAGFVDKNVLLALMRNASAFVTPSLIEGFGLSVLEGMLNSVPVIASDIPAHREVAADAALYFRPNDFNALAEAIHRVAEDPELRAQLISRGLERAKKFTIQSLGEKTLKVYSEVFEST